MNAPKHTPGEWIRIDGLNAESGIVIVRAEDWAEEVTHPAPIIARAYTPADAALIVAAPRLLAALRAFVEAEESAREAFGPEQMYALNVAIEEGAAAIAEAEAAR